MRKFIILLIVLFLFRGANSEMIGAADGRRYISQDQWYTYPYNLTLRAITSSGGVCTAQYIYKNLIATADHCVEGTGLDFVGPNGKFHGYLVARGNAKDVNGRKNDWAIYRTDDQKYFIKSDWFEVASSSTTGDVQLASFASLRILNNTEIKKIKEILTVLLEHNELNIRTLFETYDISLKSSNNAYLLSYSALVQILEELLVKAGIPKIYGDEEKLKLDEHCSIIKLNYEDNQLASNCDGSAGSSGGALVSKDGFKVLGIISNGPSTIGDPTSIMSGAQMLATQTEYFYPKFQELIQNNQEQENPLKEECNAMKKKFDSKSKELIRIFNSTWDECKNGGSIDGVIFSDSNYYKTRFNDLITKRMLEHGLKLMDNISLDCDTPSESSLKEMAYEEYKMEKITNFLRLDFYCENTKYYYMLLGEYGENLEKAIKETDKIDRPSGFFLQYKYLNNKDGAPGRYIVYLFVNSLDNLKFTNDYFKKHGFKNNKYFPKCFKDENFSKQVYCETGRNY